LVPILNTSHHKAAKSVFEACSVSSAVPQAARFQKGPALRVEFERTGEERHLTHGMASYAVSCCWGAFFTPTAAQWRTWVLGQSPKVFMFIFCQKIMLLLDTRK